MGRIAQWLLFVYLVGLGLALSYSTLAAESNADGIWVGKIRQVNVGSETTYPMTLKLMGKSGTTDYPSLNCGGKLTKLGTANGQTVYSETIIYGRVDQKTGEGCIDGFVVVQRHGSSLILEWSGSYSGQPYVAAAVLKISSKK